MLIVFKYQFKDRTRPNTGALYADKFRKWKETNKDRLKWVKVVIERA